MSSTTETQTPTPTRIVHLAALAEALKSGDRPALARVLGELADELMDIAGAAPTRGMHDDFGRLHETFHYLAIELGADR